MQWLAYDWDGTAVQPPVGFSMQMGADELVLCAQRAAAAQVRPGSRSGEFTPLLWKYDVAEFFLRGKGVKPYMEINLAPNGAWWAAVFDEPRVDHPGFDAASMPVRSFGRSESSQWEAELHLPLAALETLGWELSELHACASAVLRQADGSYRYTSTSMRPGEKPDFHRPWDWALAQIRA